MKRESDKSSDVTWSTLFQHAPNIDRRRSQPCTSTNGCAAREVSTKPVVPPLPSHLSSLAVNRSIVAHRLSSFVFPVLVVPSLSPPGIYPHLKSPYFPSSESASYHPHSAPDRRPH